MDKLIISLSRVQVLQLYQLVVYFQWPVHLGVKKNVGFCVLDCTKV